MTLEATLLCIDNSEWSRNADYLPSRFEAQQECVNLICGSKMQTNPENAVGVLTMAHDRVDVRVAPTDDIGKILQALHCVTEDGVCDFVRAIQTAQLALKHRMNTNQRQRIIVFICSPVNASERQLEQLGKMLKKNSVSLDIISFGTIEENSGKLQKLFQAVNSSDTSHIVECTAGAGLLSDMVMSSSIIMGENAPPPGTVLPSSAAAAAGGPDFAGVDPSADPELYMALRMSLEEERARLQREQTAAAAPADEGASSSAAASGGTAAEADATETAVAASGGDVEASATASGDTAAKEGAATDAATTVQEIEGMEGLDEELRQALLLSLQDYEEAPGSQPAAKTDTAAGASGTEEQQTSSPPEQQKVSDSQAAAPAAPQSDTKPSASADASSADASSATAEGLQDASFVRQLIDELPGVLTAPQIQAALGSAIGSSTDEESKKGEDDVKKGEDS